jgi:hypothetical protein
MHKLLSYVALGVSVLAALPVAMKLGGFRWPSLSVGIVLHLLSACLCAAAIRSLNSVSEGRREKGEMWLIFVLVACIAMPAYGCFSMIAIYLLQRMRGRRPPPTVSDEITVQGEDVFRNGKPRTSGLEILERLDIEPFVDIFRSGGPQLKRSAVKFLSAIKTQAAVKTLNRALMSDDVEVRLYAAGVIGLIDDNYAKEIDARKAAHEAHPEDLRRGLFLAQISMAYAESGLLDTIASAYYYREAAALLKGMPEGPEVNFMLARALCALGENDEAKEKVERCLSVDEANPVFNRLLCRILFDQRNYEGLSRAVARMRDESIISPEDELVKVWV